MVIHFKGSDRNWKWLWERRKNDSYGLWTWPFGRTDIFSLVLTASNPHRLHKKACNESWLPHNMPLERMIDHVTILSKNFFWYQSRVFRTCPYSCFPEFSLYTSIAYLRSEWQQTTLCTFLSVFLYLWWCLCLNDLPLQGTLTSNLKKS